MGSIDNKINSELEALNNMLDEELTDINSKSKEKSDLSQKDTVLPAADKLFDDDMRNVAIENKEKNKEELLKEYLNNGKRMYMRSNHSEAMQYFQKAIEIDQNNVLAIFNMGIIYIDREEQELAMKQFERVLEIKPDDYKSLCNLGGIYYKLGRYREAFDILNRAISINPNDLNSLQNLKLLEKKLLNSKK
ncbi:tetratricopeptide repeat protein [Candidatus Dependentiae bacterium]|nr:tetratricopeptide repeat protein [Candidatus Dependentiae bacterium]